ncbi:MAG: glycoside hydrolase family 9 protein [Clostridia bacterium]|nr:glycoside hydrolase family 9 protein [Clostridia bacterium]
MNIQINQLGYTPGMTKTAVLRGKLGSEMSAVNAAGETVLTLPVNGERTDIWEDEVAVVDFSALKAEGVYTLRCGEENSYPFPVTAKPYDACLNALVDMFYYQRCGGEVDARAGVHAHAACHIGMARVHGSDETMEVSGGWHDAGDYGRYIVPAAKAVADLLLGWQWNPAAFAHPNLTELLPEVRWELEWMLKMQRADGAVYHKVSCATFCGMIMPEEEQEELIVSPISTTATGDFAASMAMASRFYQEIDPAFAQRMKDAAVRAWDWLTEAEPIMFRNPEGIRTGGYGDRSDADERLWAAVELAITCGDEKYHTYAAKAIAEENRTLVSLGWGNVSGYAALEGMQLEGELGDICRQWVVDAAQQLLEKINAYGICMTDRLPWGSNMNISNDGMVLYQAWKLTGEEKFRIGAEKQLHHLLGVNPVGYCYVSCYGSQPMLHPHHRPSVATGVCVPGLLSGGAASGMMDAVAREKLQGAPAGKSFVDDQGSYSTNEICVYWNSPMVALLAGLVED